MDKMTIETSTPVRSTLVAEPDKFEAGLGLWLDRTGQARDGRKNAALRLLHNYGVLEVLEGTGWFYSPPAGWRSIVAGTGFWLFPDVPHFYQAQTEWRTRWIVFNGPWVDRVRALNYLRPEDPFFPENAGLVGEAFHALQSDRNADPGGRALLNFHALSGLLVGLFRYGMNRKRQPHPLPAKVMRYVRENFAAPLSPEGIAARFGVSHSHLRSIFKTQTGIGVKQFVVRERIARAKALLLDTNLPPKQVAEEVGYDDYLYFMRVFKKSTGMTAGAFRSSVRHG